MTAIIDHILLDQFRVDVFIASGGMGTVYKVWDLKRNVFLAMKVLHGDLAEDPTAFKYFQREADALRNLAHPNIIPFYGLYKTDEFAFMLEQFVDGSSLREILRKQSGGMPISDAMIYLKALCSALGYSHSNGVVHCDIKPSNVMVNRVGQIYLTDFGIARYAQSTTTTIAGAGTPAYMAPEQIRIEQVMPATDVYALGILLFEMLTGQRPFRGDEPETMRAGGSTGDRIRYAHLYLQPPNPSTLNSAIPAALSAVILKALSKFPQKRYSDAQSFYRAACKAVGLAPEKIPELLSQQFSLSVAPPIVPQTLPSIKPKKDLYANSRRTYALIGGGIFLLLLGFLTYWMKIPSGDNNVPSPFVLELSTEVFLPPTATEPPTPYPSRKPENTTHPPTDSPVARIQNNLAFVSDRYQPIGYLRTFVIDPENPDPTIYQPYENPPGYERAQWPTFCGEQLAVEAFDMDSKYQWIYLLGPVSTFSRWPEDESRIRNLGVPQCSPDGKYLAYSAEIGNSYSTLIIKDLASKNIIVQEAFGQTVSRVSWSNNMEAMLFPLLNGDNWSFHLTKGWMNNSFEPSALTYDGTNPALSPDGKKVAYACPGDDQFPGDLLCVAEVESRKISRYKTNLDRSARIKFNEDHKFWIQPVTPVWSADGQWIYFIDQDGGDYDIFRIQPDGTRLENITREWPSNEFMPATR
jgi:serine/threonine protein kinase